MSRLPRVPSLEISVGPSAMPVADLGKGLRQRRVPGGGDPQCLQRALVGGVVRQMAHQLDPIALVLHAERRTVVGDRDVAQLRPHDVEGAHEVGEALIVTHRTGDDPGEPVEVAEDGQRLQFDSERRSLSISAIALPTPTDSRLIASASSLIFFVAASTVQSILKRSASSSMASWLMASA
jgi:hypothetical protein